MFGHQDDKKDDDESSEQENVITPDQTAGANADTSATDQTGQAASGDETSASEAAEETNGDDDQTAGASGDDNAWQHPGAPLTDDKDEGDDEDEPDEDQPDKGPAPIKDIVGTNAGPDFRPFPQGTDSEVADNTPHELIDIKQKALNDLLPLADKLDLSPEDKFRTTMMMIQASDDQSLVESAYEAAHKIKDEKVRAQALLDIVNEINYFTQHSES